MRLPRLARAAALALLALGVVVVAAAALVLAIEFTLPLDAQRESIAAAASRSLGAEVRIGGPLRLITGTRPGIEAGGLHLAFELQGRTIAADLDRVRLRLRWPALLAREIRLSEAAVDGAKLCMSAASGPPGVARAPAAPHEGGWRFAGIDALHIDVVTLRAGTDCAALPGVVELRTLSLNASGGEALQVSASGALAGEAWQLDLQGPPLQSLADATAPVPFKLVVKSAESKLSAEGKLLLSPISAEADVVFDSPQFAAHIRPLGAPFKDFGPLSLRGQVRADVNRMTLRLDEAGLAPGVVRGDVEFDWSGPLPRLAARARTDRLDTAALQRWLDDSIDSGRVHPGRLQRQIIAGVRASEGNLAVDVGQVAAGRARFDAVAVDASWREGRGKASYGARLGTVDFKGTMEADVRKDELSFAAAAHTGAVALKSGKGVTATAGGVAAKSTARGRLGEDLGASVRVAVDAPNAMVSVPRDGGGKLSIALDTLHAEWQARDTLAVTTSGNAFGERFEARLEGADALRLFRGEQWQLNASGALGPLRLESKGTLALRDGKPLAQLDVAAAAEDLGSFVPESVAKLPLEARGRVELAQAGWRAELASLRWGRTQGRGSLRGPTPAAPLTVEAAFDALDLAVFAGQGGTGDAWERAWLPRRLVLPDADLALRAGRVMLPGGATAKVAMNPRTRGGRLEQAPFTLELEGASVRGNLSADLRQDAAVVTAEAEARGLDENHFGQRAADGDISIKVGSASLKAAATGNRLGELAASAELRLDLADTRVALERRGKGPQLEATLSETALSIAPGRATQFKMSGALAGEPLSFEAQSGPLSAWLPPGRAPFSYSLAGHIAGLNVAAKGAVPTGRGAAAEGALDVRVSAERLDALNALLNADLPPVGPFTLEAVRSKSGQGETVAEVKIALGESRLEGRVAARRAGERPAFDIDLTSPLLRLEDLGAGAPARPPEPAGEGKRPPPAKRLEKDVQLAQAMMDEARGALSKFDARLRLEVSRITAGREDAGRAVAVARLESGRLQLAPFKLNGAGGSLIEVELDADMAGEDPGYRFAATVDHLRYGQLMKSLYPDHPADGELSLKLKLSGHGAFESMVPTLQGSAGLVVFPSDLPSRFLDRLGGGLVRNVGSNLDVEKSSHVNCAVATFDIALGRAKSTALMLDSERVRAAGELEADFANGTLQGQIVPKSKRPELFGTSLPVTIGGTLAAPKIAPLAGSLAVTAARYYYFAYAFLFDAVTTKNLAEDGRPDCSAAYERLAK